MATKLRVRLLESVKEATRRADEAYAKELKKSERICRDLDKAADRGAPSSVTDPLCDAVVRASAEARQHKHTAHGARSKLLKLQHAMSRRRKWPAMKRRS